MFILSLLVLSGDQKPSAASVGRKFFFCLLPFFFFIHASLLIVATVLWLAMGKITPQLFFLFEEKEKLVLTSRFRYIVDFGCNICH